MVVSVGLVSLRSICEMIDLATPDWADRSASDWPAPLAQLGDGAAELARQRRRAGFQHLGLVLAFDAHARSPFARGPL